jgi:uncharacterized membrane protein YtjA (UPF0391 family)
MLGLAFVSLIVALVAGALGLTGVARGAAMIAKVIFGLFFFLALLLFILFFTGVNAVSTP